MKQDPGGEEYYYLYNGHGDVVQIIDKAGNILNHYEYDEWGNIADQIETIDNDFKYCGEIYDDETGLYYLRARYYDPSVGRFISEDSNEGNITNPLSLNLYTYCANNPVKYIDPSGNIYTFADPMVPGPQTIERAQQIWDFIKPNEADVAYFQAGGPYGPEAFGAGYLVRRGGKLIRFVDEAVELGKKTAKVEVKWTSHGYKHFPPKNAKWESVIKLTKSGPAKYKPGTDIEALERQVWKEGIKTTNGKNWRAVELDDVIGACEGRETKYIRVEESVGTIHGHPITEAEYKKLTK